MQSLPFLLSGIIFGLTAGLSPGPLLTLVISETLKHSKKEGIKIAVAPLITDLPIVLITVLILAKLSDFNLILGAISFSGAVFLGYLAFESISIKDFNPDPEIAGDSSLGKGVIANFLNPHPYTFWFLVGAPTVLKAWNINILSVIFFISGFYGCLIGSKIAVALLVEKTKPFLKSSIYTNTVRVLGLLLLVFAIIFIMDGLKFFGVLS